MFSTLLDSIKEEMMPLCFYIIIIAKAVAVLGCLVSMSMTTIKYMVEGDKLNIWGYAKPLAIVFCILTFDTLVLGTIDGIMRSIGKATSALVLTYEVGYLEKADELDEAISRMPPNPAITYQVMKEEQTEAMIEENMHDFSSEDLEEISRREFAADIEYKKNWFMKILEPVMNVIAFAAKIVIQVVGVFFLIVLSILGPLAFAAACFPIFESSITNWLTRYISISLWIPATDIMTVILSRVQIVLCSTQLENIDNYGVVNGLLALAMSVVGIFGYLSVPSVTSWLIESGGTGSYVRNMTYLASQLIRSGSGKGGSSFASALRGMAAKYGKAKNWKNSMKK